MSFYYEAAQILEAARNNGGSLKSIVFSKKDWKSEPKSLYAVATETVKWSEVLSETIEKSDILKKEKQLTPILALLLAHDLLLSKKGVALPLKQYLYVSISRHKARLTAELTKARLRRGYATVDALRTAVNNNQTRGQDGNIQNGQFYPRWIRINTLRTTLEEQLNTTFAECSRSTRLAGIAAANANKHLIYIDEHIPNLVAVSADFVVTTTAAYKQGKLLLQDKASCFPAYLLDPTSGYGVVIDACAAPGNKTTHLAAIVSSSDPTSPHKAKIIACERDLHRSRTLAEMVKLAGAGDIVRVKAYQDFLKLEPSAKEFNNVTALLLDPSCSGSGIVGRDEVTVKIRLPGIEDGDIPGPRGKKRKRKMNGEDSSSTAEPVISQESEEFEEERPTELDADSGKLETRLRALSDFQLRLLLHAMAFPAAERIIYSTCSVHAEENEQVVVKALLSPRAIERGWRVLRRHEQVEGLRKWDRRGDLEAVVGALRSRDGRADADEVVEGGIRCAKGGQEGTMGFFVAGFVRNIPNGIENGRGKSDGLNEDNTEDEWNGFSDDES